MTNAVKRTILEDAIDRGLQMIQQAPAEDLKGEAFNRLFRNLLLLDAIRISLPEDPGEVNGLPEVDQEPAPAADEPEENEGGSTGEAEEGNTGESADRGGEPEAEQEPEEPGSENPEEKTLTLFEVRAALAKARGKGVDVQTLLRKFGVRDLLALPESRYADIMEAVKQELADAT